MRDYLLEPRNRDNQGKAEWFQRALGFNKNNWRELERQIQFDAAKAVYQKTIPYGHVFNQNIIIQGANGRSISVEFGFIKDSISGKVRFLTGMPPRK